MNLITDIAESDFASQHPELHDYLDFAGLNGIFSTKTIWATNYRQLNDTKETAMLRTPLVLLCQQFDEVVDIIGFFKNG
jgi:hypothetical protein